MTTRTRERESERSAVQSPEVLERGKTGRVYVPLTDIYETADDIIVVADMPGVDDKSVDVTLEKNVLTIEGVVHPEIAESYTKALCEYRVGDYRRVFILPNEVDRDGIQASVKNGVLRVVLPKSSEAKVKRIKVKAQ